MIGGAKVHVVNPLDFDFNFELAGRSTVTPQGMVDALLGLARAANDAGHLPESSALAHAIAARIHAGTVNINEGYAAAWGSTAAPMGGMGVSGVGRRHGEEGLYKYTEPQTIAEQRFIGLDGMRGVPKSVFLKVTPKLMGSLKYLPGR